MNTKQFYVTVSRGRKNVAIYVDDKAAVRRAIQIAVEQRSATELKRFCEFTYALVLTSSKPKRTVQS